MKAIVLCAGRGIRLMPLTKSVPKVAISIGDKPLIEHTIRWLNKNGISQIAFNLGYLGKEVYEIVNKCRYNGSAQYVFSVEKDKLLGTSGALNNFRDYFDSRFLVIYGDVLTDMNLDYLLAYHVNNKADMTMVVCPNIKRKDVGSVLLDSTNSVIDFAESNDKYYTFYNGGIYVLERKILDYIPQGFSDFGYNIIPELIEKNVNLKGYILPNNSYLLDIGTLERYQQANNDVEKGKVKLYG